MIFLFVFFLSLERNEMKKIAECVAHKWTGKIVIYVLQGWHMSGEKVHHYVISPRPFKLDDYMLDLIFLFQRRRKKNWRGLSWPPKRACEFYWLSRPLDAHKWTFVPMYKTIKKNKNSPSDAQPLRVSTSIHLWLFL